MNEKSIIYVVKNKETKKWYVGSTKQIAKFKDQEYLGSGIAVKEAVEQYGPEVFESIILETFDDRPTAYYVEGLLLEHIDAKGDNNSYNRTNSVTNWKTGADWERAGFKQKTIDFPLLKRKLNNDDKLNEWEKIINKEVEMGEYEPGTPVPQPTPGPTPMPAPVRQVVEGFRFDSNLGEFLNRAAQGLTLIGEEAGVKDPSRENLDNQLSMFKDKLVGLLNNELYIKENSLDMIDIVSDTTDDGIKSNTDIRLKTKLINREIIFLKDQMAQVEKNEGWFGKNASILKSSFRKGAVQYGLNKINNV